MMKVRLFIIVAFGFCLLFVACDHNDKIDDAEYQIYNLLLKENAKYLKSNAFTGIWAPPPPPPPNYVERDSFFIEMELKERARIEEKIRTVDTSFIVLIVRDTLRNSEWFDCLSDSSFYRYLDMDSTQFHQEVKVLNTEILSVDTSKLLFDIDCSYELYSTFTKERFYKRLPQDNVGGYVAFASPLFNHNKTKAIAYFESKYDLWNASGAYYFLEKENGEWKVVKEFCAWIE